MKIKKLLIPLFILASSLSMVGCNNTDKDENVIRPYDLMWYYPFEEYLSIKEPNYDMRSAYHKVNMTGHTLTSFDEEEIIVKYVHSKFKYERIMSGQFKKTDNYVTITCGDFSRPIEQNGVITVYDNGHFSCKTTFSYTKDNKEFFFKADKESTDTLFNLVEKDLAKIENGERHYYEDIKKYCSLERFLETADADLARESDYCNLDLEVTHPYRVATGYISSNLTNTKKESVQEMIDMIKATPHTFKGYKSVDYNAIDNSILAIDYENDYASYGYILEGGKNFTTAGVTKVYGDYKDGNYHFLIAEYEISHEDGERMFDVAYAPLKNRN